ncbi:Uncharacterised protein [Mycobacteroides abscessus subsp. abscessus]|uniref:hypothetical protein n=1 Tax=Mycobacteroides abscessus TaxID=36809 RepID=UPI000928D07D|nr:hypothetical protein [Mycobacteroides abscessus]SHY07998.1 Uncharacterised protein [Mycobacteroides abscessus subsp. abscessus]SIC75641.1 Uncharacterised protein [Mycobacteroides abscessus subsp. abscessus]SKP28545.1 Uncharacterised protein [Mycobacteroides abscessus subsp. abscessus]
MSTVLNTATTGPARANESIAAPARMVAPLRKIAAVRATGRQGREIGPHHFWLAREFEVTLECGHKFLTARDDYDRTGDPDRLSHPITGRFRCIDCPTRPSKGRPRRKGPNPDYDPLISALVTAACHADNSCEAELLAWIVQNGRFVDDDERRERAYRAIVLALVDRYVHDAQPARGPAVRQAVYRWALDPSPENIAAARMQTRRLYKNQHNGGQWHANRGVIAAAAAMSPAARRRTTAVLEALTWDSESREPFYSQLFAKRAELDAIAVVGSDEHVQAAQSALSQAYSEGWPSISHTHVPVVKHLLAIYLHEISDNTAQLITDLDTAASARDAGKD